MMNINYEAFYSLNFLHFMLSYEGRKLTEGLFRVFENG